MLHGSSFQRKQSSKLRSVHRFQDDISCHPPFLPASLLQDCVLSTHADTWAMQCDKKIQPGSSPEPCNHMPDYISALQLSSQPALHTTNPQSLRAHTDQEHLYTDQHRAASAYTASSSSSCLPAPSGCSGLAFCP